MRIKKLLSLLMATVMVITLLPSSAFADPADDHQLTKKAEWVDEEAGLAKITLRTEGTPITQTTGADVVMVLDASGSMNDYVTVQSEAWVSYRVVSQHIHYNILSNYLTVVLTTASGNESEPFNVETNYYGTLTNKGQNKLNQKLNETMYEKSGTRWEIATDAVKALTDEVIPNTSTENRLGLVVFSSSGYSQNSYECDLTNNSDDILDEIPSSPEGGTNYTTALRRAYNMLEGRADRSRPAYVVFLTDGEPGLQGNSGNDRNWNGVNEIAALKAKKVTIYTVGFNLTNGDATNRLQGYATSSAHYQNISNAGELSGLLSGIGSSIVSSVTVHDSVNTTFFTIAKKPNGSNNFVYANGNVICTNDKDITWSLDSFSQSGDTLEIYIQLKSQYMNQNRDYPTNDADSAYGTYKNESGNDVNLPVSRENGSNPVPTLNVLKMVLVNFAFVGTNPEKASFNTPAQANQSVQIGSTVTNPGVTVAPGYQISNWYTDSSCTGVPFNFSTAISANAPIHLYASVDVNENAKYTYTVNFYKNNTLSGSVAGNVWAGAPTVTIGHAKALRTGNYSNYSFSKATVGTQDYTLDDDEIAIAANGSTAIAVYYTAGAVNLNFKRGEHGKFTAVAEQNEASVIRSTQYDASFTDVPEITDDLGWQQEGWYEEEDAAQAIVTFPQIITGAKTYVMKYTKNVASWKSVTFHLNDGTTTPYRVVNEILVGHTISNSNWPENPDKNGFEFLGWFTKDGTNGDWGTQFIQTSNVNADTTVYAKWRKTVTDVRIHYYLGSTSGTELSFSAEQKVANATIGSSYASYISDALKERGTAATNQDAYYEISKENAVVYINGTIHGSQLVADGDVIQVVYPVKMGTFKVMEIIPGSTPEYLSEYEASLEHRSGLKYGDSETDLTVTEINKILSASLSATEKSNPGAKIKSVSIKYQELNASGTAEWKTPVSAILNNVGTAVTSFPGLDQLSIHGGCETRLAFEYELPIEVHVEYHRQLGDTSNYVVVPNKAYVVGGGASYVYQNDELSIVNNADSLKNINKVVPAGVEGYQVARVATQDAPATTITGNTYQVTQPTTFIVYLNAITANGGKIVNVDNNGAALVGGAFAFNEANLTADSNNENEYPITRNLVYGVEYTITQTDSTPGYDKVPDFKVKLKADGTGLELIGTVTDVTVNGMTVTIANKIDANQKFAYTVNRYITGTETAVPGLPALAGESPLGNFTWTNAASTTTGYKLMENQPESLRITTNAGQNVANVYYEVDSSQTRSYKVTYWKDGEATPFSTSENLTVLEADPMVAYEDILMNNIPIGYKLKDMEFAGNALTPNEKVVITSTQHEIKVIYEKDAAKWVNIVFKVGGHGTWSNDKAEDVVVNAIKGSDWSDYSSQVPEPKSSEIGWKLADGTWDKALPNTKIPNEDLVYTARWIADNAAVSFEIVGDKHGAENPAGVAVQKGTKTTAPVVTADKGYKVVGWYTDKGFENVFNFDETAITGDTKLYAKVVEKDEDWTTITFKAGDHGKWSDNATTDVVVKAIKGAAWSNYSGQVPPVPVQSEIGWKLADGTWNPALPSASDTIPNTGLVYTAQWIADNAAVSFEIVGDKHGAENPAGVAVQKGAKTTAPVVTADKGYKVVGWYTDKGFENVFNFDETAITGDTKLYAKVVVKDEDWTTITFEPGYVGQWADGAKEFVVINAIKGAKWSDYSTQVPEAPVQTEIGWKLKDEIQVWHQPLPNATDEIPDNGLNYTAVWARDNATVSFEFVGETHGAVNPADELVQKGKIAGAPVVAVNKGYKVDGWYIDQTCQTKFSFSDAILQDTKLYAQIVEKEADWSTITFKAGDHGKWSDNTTTDVIVKAIKGAAWSNYITQVPPVPVQSEIGWKLVDGTWDPVLPSASDVIPDAGLVYTAQWVPDNADVSFEIVGDLHGAVNPASVIVQKGAKTTAPVVTADKGYKVVGWYTDKGFENAFNFDETAISENTKLYAKVVMKEEEWAKVTFKAGENGLLNNGSEDVAIVETDPILIGEKINRAIPSLRSNAGYEFEAWYKVTEGETGTVEVLETPTQDTEVLGYMTYLAKFTSLLNVNFVIDSNKATEGTTSPVIITDISNGTPWDSIAVPSVQGKLRENQYSRDYKFTGWDAAFPETVTSNLTFRAQFDNVYTFVVEHADLNNGSYPNKNINYYKKEAGAEISGQANAPVRGYELTNITVYVNDTKLDVATTAKLIQKLKDDYNITLTEDGTLSGTMPNDCIWIKYGYEKLAERTVQYVSDGTVSDMPDNITDRYKGDEITVSTAVPHRDGFDFGGWEVVGNVVEVVDGKFIMPDGDVKLSAVWTPNEEVWNYTVSHYLEGSEIPFKTTQGTVLKREPDVGSIVIDAPQGYKFKQYQINGDPTELPITIGEDGHTISVIYEKNDLIVKHVYGDFTVYDTVQSKANVEDGSVVVNAVNSGRYTRLNSVTVNGKAITPDRNVMLRFSEIGKYEVVFVYGRSSSDSGSTPGTGNTSDGKKDFGEEVTILDEEVPLADGLDMINHFAYIFGYKDGTVKPKNKISREEVAAIFYRLLNDSAREKMKSTSQKFPDVSSQRWSNNSIATLSNGGVIAGYPGGEFRPGNAITRAEFAVIVSKFDNLSKTDTNQFKDIEGHWAKDFINSAALKGWISGYPDGTFHPDDYITRAEAMTLINSVLNRKVSKEGLLENAKYWSDNSADSWYYEAVMEATNSHDYTRETPDGVETWTAITPNKSWD